MWWRNFLAQLITTEVKKYSGKREDLTSVAGRIEAATCGSRKKLQPE